MISLYRFVGEKFCRLKMTGSILIDTGSLYIPVVYLGHVKNVYRCPIPVDGSEVNQLCILHDQIIIKQNTKAACYDNSL